MPYISKDFIDNVLDDCRLESIISDFVTLKEEGANLKGLSPFTEERTPSFIVSPSKQIWKCFSTGKGGNNAVSFLMENGYNYPDAIAHLAKKQGRSLQYEDTKEARAYQEKQVKIIELRPILKAAINQYQKQFEALLDDHEAKKEVFQKRQYNKDVVDTYQIGYAPGGQYIYRHLKEKGLVQQGIDTSLITGKNDFYFNRVTYTIFDANGNPIGMAGRGLGDDPKPKWLNSRSSLLYNKEFVWYGMHIAKTHARQENAMYIVEGYNDVIGFHVNGLLNTVAPCGTSIHDNQIKVLRKYVDEVFLCMDGDNAGRASALKNIPRFLEAGFRCSVVSFKDVDADEFVRLHEDAIQKNGLRHTLEKETNINRGFKVILEQLNGKDDVEKSTITKALCDLISKIEDDSLAIIYQQWLQKESGITLKQIKDWTKEHLEQRTAQQKAKYLESNEYELPKGIEMTEDILNDVRKYQLFMANHTIYSQVYSDRPYKFRSVSNFELTIIQHMRDEDFPKKLVSAQNVFNESFVFDVPSDTFNADGTFKKAMTNFGNFRWFGRSDDLTRLQAYIFDKMGNGRSLDVLGWQAEGFFLFNNLVVVPDEKKVIVPDKNGCFKYKNISYYVPSANVIYKDNPYKYMPQKQFRHIPGTISSLEYFAKVYRVHGQHAISSIFHAIACMFHDIVIKNLKGFPINFSYGPPGTGKDELNHAVKSLWGIPQVATNLEGKNATKTATIRELAQFTNTLLEWSEYGRGDNELDGTIKSVWDLRGKKVGKFESRVATDNVPVLSGIALTGNEYPDNPAIITRIIWNDMNRTEFTEADEKEFNELNDIIDEGITHITVNILNQRPLVKKLFNEKYRLLMDVYQRRIPDCNKRMLKNISTLTAFYTILKDEIDFPFTHDQILDHFTTITIAQMRKLTSSSILSRWWDCFIASMRGVDHDKIKVGREIKLEGTKLYFQFTRCYNKLQRQWFTQYRDSAPAKSTMKEAIEKDSAYYGYESRIDYKKGAPRVQSSAMVIDIMRLPEDLRELIKSEVEQQEFDSPDNPFSPEPPKNQKNKDKSVEYRSQGDLPF